MPYTLLYYTRKERRKKFYIKTDKTITGQKYAPANGRSRQNSD